MSITHGDVFVVDLRIIQVADDSGIWVNDAYEVVEVSQHVRRAHQQDLLSGSNTSEDGP